MQTPNSLAISPAISLRAPGARVFFYHLAENLVVKGQVRVHLLEFGVLVLKFLETLELAYFKPAVLAFSLVQRSSRYIQTPTDFVRRYTCLKFVYAFNNLRFGVSQFLHGCSFATKGSILTMAGLPFCLVMNSPNYGEAYNFRLKCQKDT